MPSHRRVAVALGTLYLSGGSTYLAIRVMVGDGIPPLLGTGLRFTIAGIALLLLAAATGRVRVARRELASAAALGVPHIALSNGAIALAERDLSSSLTALLVSSVALWVVVLRLTVLRERVERRVLLGVAGGAAGIAVLTIPGHAVGAGSATGVALALMAPLVGAVGLLATPRMPLPRDLLPAAAWQMACGGTALLAVAVAHGDATGFDAAAVPLEAWVALAHLVVVGSWLMFGSYLWLALNVPPSLVATQAYAVPLVATALGWLVLGEPIGVALALGGALIVGSVALTVWRTRPARRPSVRWPRARAGVRARQQPDACPCPCPDACP